MSLGLILACGLFLAIGSLILNAGPRVQAEDESSLRLAQEFVETAVVSLGESRNPGVALDQMMKSLRHLRHVDIFVVGSKVDPSTWRRSGLDRPSDIPTWFKRFIGLKQTFRTVPVEVAGLDYGQIVIASNPLDEAEEIWTETMDLAVGGAALILVLLAVIVLVVDRSLRSVSTIGEAMAQLAAGDYSHRLRPSGPPEIAGIGERVNILAAALDEATTENRRLAEKIISLQDDERRELARELHDEFGPFLFSIRAHATSLARSASRGEIDAARFQSTCASMLEQVDALQKVNRRLLGRLRPVAFGDLGLKEALRALVAMWRGSHPSVEVKMALEAPVDGLDETVGLTVYRIVQEGLTNVFRHAGATRVDVGVDLAAAEAAAGKTSIRVRVRDNGIGLPAGLKQGFGLLGMSERVWALRGRLDFHSLPEGGAVLEAVLPLA